MNASLPPHLLPVLQLKVRGYSNRAIADELQYTPATIETYHKRLILFFKNTGQWDERLSSKIGLLVCGQQYLEQQAAIRSPADKPPPAPATKSPPQNREETGSELWPPLSPVEIEQALHSVLSDPYERGLRSILFGNLRYREWRCREAISLFQSAEHLLGPASGQAAVAACRTAQMYIELGDLHQATQTIRAAHYTYATIADLDATIELQHLHGWVDFEQGNLTQAELGYKHSLALAHSTGMPHIGRHAHHFLGRIYNDLAQLAKPSQQADQWFHLAEDHLDQAYTLHGRWGNDGDRGYDLFRKAQVLNRQSRWREARDLCKRARALLANGRACLHIEQEEAMLACKNGDEKTALRKAEKVLGGWSEVQHTQGIAEALKTLGRVKHQQGACWAALEHYVSALCIHPYDNSLSNKLTWAAIAEIIDQTEDSTAQRYIEQLHAAIQTRQGSFAYLNATAVDRTLDSLRIGHKLASLTPTLAQAESFGLPLSG